MKDLAYIPTELWRTIFTAACTDGGFTGRSLALTSRFFQTQSISVRFHTLALKSLDRIEDFLAFFSVQPEECKPRIEHLFLSTPTPPGCDLISIWTDEYSKLSVEEKRARDKKVLDARKVWNDRVLAALVALFKIVSPMISTLTMVVSVFDLPRTPFYGIVFPRLQELTVMGSDIVTFLALDVDNTLRIPRASHLEAWSRLPALRRLHCIQPDGVLQSLAYSPSPPSLTHLRLSGVWLASSDMDVQGVRYLMGLEDTHGLDQSHTSLSDLQTAPPTEQASRVDSPLPKLPRLEHFIIHAIPPPPGGPCGTPYLTWGLKSQAMVALARECEPNTGIRMLFMGALKPWPPSRWTERVHAEWLSRIEGGRGCWNETQEEEIEIEEVYKSEHVPPKFEF